MHAAYQSTIHCHDHDNSYGPQIAGLKIKVQDLKERVLYLEAELKRQEQRYMYHAS